MAQCGVAGSGDPPAAPAHATGAPPASEFGAAHHGPDRCGRYDADDENDGLAGGRFTEIEWPTGRSRESEV